MFRPKHITDTAFRTKVPYQIRSGAMFLIFSIFLKIYPILARCYSLGILLLFIIAAIYPRRLKHPLIYTMLIILTANTSIMALAGATALGILFVYDLLKYKKNAEYRCVEKSLYRGYDSHVL